MRGIILAGGFGTRLRPLIGEMPKCLAPVMGRPMVSIVMSQMKKHGITDITLSLHYKAEEFIKRFGDSVKYNIEKEALGTGGAIKSCIRKDDDIVIVSNGDTICPVDYTDMIAHHISPLSIAITQKMGLMMSAGIYIINPELFDNAPEGKFSFEEFISNKMKKFYHVDFFTDLGTPESYKNCPKDWV